MKFCSLILTYSLMILVLHSVALACTCVPTAPCQNFDRADVVFVGKVVGSKYQRTEDNVDYSENANTSPPATPKKITYDIGEVYFQVDEAFRGIEKGMKVAIHSNTGGGDCGYWFRRGQTYVVFASKEGSRKDSGISSLTFGGSSRQLQPDAERLWTSICSGTSERVDSERTLRYLRDLPKEGSGGMILGRIDESIKDYSDENLTGKPLVDSRIKAEQIDGENKVFYGTSNNEGYFEIKVPVGRYLVSPELSSQLNFKSRFNDNEGKAVEIKDRKCETRLFWVTNDSEITGKVVDSNGRSFGNISLDLIPADKNRKDRNFDYKFEYVGEDGLFSFKGIPLGRYQISLNYKGKPDDDSPYPTSFYPITNDRSEAKVFKIGYGTKFNDLVFQLPPKLEKRKIYGQVVWKDGKPAVNAEVQLNDVEFARDAFFKAPRTNEKGEFVFDWFEGRIYKIKVMVWKMSKDGQSGFGVAETESQEFVLDQSIKRFRLVLNITNPGTKLVRRRTVRAN